MQNPLSQRAQARLLIGIAGAVAAGALLWLTWPTLSAARHRLATASGQRVVDIIKYAAWPAVAALSIMLLRTQLAGFVTALAQRANKVSVFNIEIELAEVSQLHSSSPSTAIQEIKTAFLGGDSSGSLAKNLDGPPVDFAVVDLGTGTEWLTSRVYIVATLLRRMRSIRTIVFLATGTRERQVLGVVLPDSLRTRFDDHYPWLGEALQAEYAKLHPSLGSRTSLQASEAEVVLTGFLNSIQLMTPNMDWSEWVAFPSGGQEHAQWLDAALLSSLLASDLHRSVLEWKPTFGPQDGRDAISKTGPFVALVDREGVFRDVLVDRMAMLETIAKEVSAQPRGDA
jgi:hypothetical protein